ncbi:LuxR family maltose regulon positive regulatory protein [Ruminiclostridium sufflavum DSM 19573]|uniref:LuxR family maltose regulon positive regulatory protein n=1 Tax=Ruminiclostridium sufflavum DSM 19573 TaxID=1121337 RepID=A0A318Y7X6_9FIRM|nr:LuxR C-terminal-related transcriptional regulator [Ruminiclostridium sufflavum]PYG88254.1 LuxR family maltose regulon positive regulatory protein [Ruminiclostridium sufflavum DSM 19573]
MRKKVNHKKRYYFSDKLTRKLAQISHYPLTVVEAPFGFGKTTAVREYLKANLPLDALECWYTCLGEPVSITWSGLCELLSNADAKAADSLKGFENPTMDTLFHIASYIKDFKCQAETYLVVDNYQLVNCDVSQELINVLSMHNSPNLHLVFITQRLGAKQQYLINNNSIHTIDRKNFLLNKEGTGTLFSMEGINLADNALEKVYKRTEGWVSAIRFYMINYKETGSFNITADIEQLVESAVWDRLTQEEKEFLLSVSVMDSFTACQAAIILDKKKLPEKIEEFLRDNDFIQYIPDKHIYRMHSILLNYVRNRFNYYQPEEYQNEIYRRAGRSYAMSSQYYQAACFFYKVRDFDAILSLPFSGEYFDAQKEKYQPEFIAEIINECPDNILCRYPFTLLVFGYMAFSCGQYEVYHRLCHLLYSVIQDAERPDEDELLKIKAEYRLLASMRDFNDYSKIRKEYETVLNILCKPSDVTKYCTPCFFAAPSVLDIFWRESGKLEAVIQQLEEDCILYKKSAGGYGAGVGSLMRAEAMLMKGNEDEAEILCHRTLYYAQRNKQFNICLCSELVLARVAVLRGNAEGYLSAVKTIKGYTGKYSNSYIPRMVDQCMSVISLVLGIKDNVAPWLYDLEKINKVLYAPVVPHAQVLYLRLLLMERRYNEFYGISQAILEEVRNKAGKVQYIMPQVYILIYLAIAKLNNGNGHEAQNYLRQALAIALPDKIYLPFAQHLRELMALLEMAKGYISDREGLNALIALGIRQDKGAAAIKKAIIADKSPLTPREREIALYARDRLSAKEIADKLYISEATVRTILKSVYGKLEIHSKYELDSTQF